ncbi:homospermidine synthase [Caenimonas soli]|uniref:homospermidine synthase n=1 Tax=Caenimonas soli TaxID=2735555 RepID=UPI001553541A|nr:saccharopine dehydrogenase C-terminal domain-containing protein [Caenimonas soli]NPC57541.1 homospermidine synthase [Caenimonas soli]
MRRQATFAGRVVMLGFGSVGQGMLPLLPREFGVKPGRVKIVKTREDDTGIAAEFGAEVIATPLNEGNFETVLEPLLGKGDFLLNLSVDVSSIALMRFCRKRGAFYLDTCNEPWPGRYDNPELSPSQRSNYALREEALAFRRDLRSGPTAVLTQGANPGLVSALVKRALLNMAEETHLKVERPTSYEDWAELARSLDIKVIHIAERDSQISDRRKESDEFVNTWSVEGFFDEGLQPAELGWGSHERHWPEDAGRHGFGCDAAIYLNRPGIATRVRSWTPLEGPYHGFLVTHAESISIADHFTLRDNGNITYRPTVHYAYHPCDDAVLSLHEVAGKNWKLQRKQRIMRDEITGGMDELGVLLMGNAKGVYWYGSRLSIEQARKLAPYNTATSLQVVAGILGGMAWALRNPDAGLVEPDDLDWETVLEVAVPYLGDVVGEWGDWTPLQGRSPLFSEDKDLEDPWQFLNFLVK